MDWMEGAMDREDTGSDDAWDIWVQLEAAILGSKWMKSQQISLLLSGH